MVSPQSCLDRGIPVILVCYMLELVSRHTGQRSINPASGGKCVLLGRSNGLIVDAKGVELPTTG